MIIYMYTLHQTMPKEPIINHYNYLPIIINDYLYVYITSDNAQRTYYQSL